MNSLKYYTVWHESFLTKPTRITSQGATLIDNIFTNNMESNAVSGVLITDISDHLPVFIIYECKCKSNQGYNEVKYRRVKTEETIMASKMIQ